MGAMLLLGGDGEGAARGSGREGCGAGCEEEG